jgi:hypothetical protein
MSPAPYRRPSALRPISSLACGAALALSVAPAGCVSASERCDEERTRTACEAACREGDAKGCHRLAKILDATPHLDPVLAMSAFERSCELGSAFGCVGRRGYCRGAREDGAPRTDAERDCQRKYTELACARGDSIACRSVEKDAESAAGKDGGAD